MNHFLSPEVNAPLDNIVPPPGYEAAPVSQKTPVTKPLPKALNKLKIKRAWDLAVEPAKSIPMNLIVNYMTGSSLQMISIMMTLMLLWNPLKAIFTVDPFLGLRTAENSADLRLPRLVFIICHLANAAIGVYKLNSMGLIPNKEADWLSWSVVPSFTERVSF